MANRGPTGTFHQQVRRPQTPGLLVAPPSPLPEVRGLLPRPPALSQPLPRGLRRVQGPALRTTRLSGGQRVERAALSLPQAAPGRGRPEASQLQSVPAAPGVSGPRAPAHAPALRLRRAAHPPPLGNIRLGRGGHECACAPRPPKHRPRQATVRRAPSSGRAWDLASVKEATVLLGALFPDPSPPCEKRKPSN